MAEDKSNLDPVVDTEDTEKVEVKVEDPPTEPEPEKQKLKVGFETEESDETKKQIGSIDTVVGEKGSPKKKKPSQRTTTLAKMRKTLADGAKETADVISDASSFSLATKIEAIVWAMQESGDEKWECPENLTLAEAFVLFWRKSDGSVDGAKNSASLQALAYAAMLGDLIRLDKITAQKMNKKVGFVTYAKYVVHPTSDLEMDSFLDEPFLYIVEQHKAGKKKTIAKYVEDVATSFHEGAMMVEVILENLVESNVLTESKSTFMGSTKVKYPLGENKEVYSKLLKEVRGVLLDDGVEATPFIKFLLRLLRQADKEYVFRNPFMGNILTNKSEWNKAKTKGLANFDKLKGEA